MQDKIYHYFDMVEVFLFNFKKQARFAADFHFGRTEKAYQEGKALA